MAAAIPSTSSPRPAAFLETLSSSRLPVLPPVHNPLRREWSLTAAPPISSWIRAHRPASPPFSSLSRKTVPSPAGIPAPTSPRARRRLPSTPSWKSTTPKRGGPNGAVYKGATSGEINGHRFLYVTNFRKARIEVYDTNFKPVSLGEEAFEAEGIPRGFAPFNIQNIGVTLFVTFAKQNAERQDDVAGDGLGFVAIFTPAGKHIGHLQHGPWFNSPWGVVWTTRDFGEFSNAILVGNFASGRIAAFNGFTYKFMGFVKNPDDSILTIDGLWSLTFGNDGTAGPANTLFFTAGINGEQDGLFGTITPVDGLDGDEE